MLFRSAEIVTSAPQLRSAEVRLILQPMTKQEHLRSALYSAGFEIIAERYSSAEGKHYVCMLVAYSGSERTLSLLESHLGVSPVVGGREDYIGYLEGKLRALEVAVSGKERGGIDASEDALAARAVAKRIEQLRQG